MPLLIVVFVEVDVEVSNDDRPRYDEGEEKSRELANFNHGYGLSHGIDRIECLHDDKCQGQREDDSAGNRVGQLRRFDALFEVAGTKLAAIKVDPHGNKKPLV